MKAYRTIWIKAFGPIPTDEDGRSFEIHHRNGDGTDDRLENLQCVSIHEHFEIHLSQGDYGACASILQRLGTDPVLAAELNRQGGKIAGMKSKANQTGWHNPEVKRRGGLAMKDRRWYTNGIDNTRSFESPGPEWVIGRTLKDGAGFGFEKGRSIGVFWNKDGKNKRSAESPGKGWIRGKFMTDEQRKRRSEIGTYSSEQRWKHQRSAK
jgi:hypothetical protein